MFFYLERMKKAVSELKKRIYKDEIVLGEVYYKEGDFLNPEAAHKSLLPFEVFSNASVLQYDKRYWFHVSFDLPKEYKNSNVIFEIITGKEKGWDAINPQFLIYVNKEVSQGFDTNHNTLLIDKKYHQNSIEIDFHAFPGTQSENISIQCKIKLLNKDVQQLFFDLSVLYDTALLLDEQSTDFTNITDACIEAINSIRFTHDFESFNGSLSIAQKILADRIFNSASNNTQEVISLIGHTHIDVAWLWPLQNTREKAVRSFATVLKLMDTYEDYQFMCSQPQLYQFVKEDNPVLYERIKDKVKQGRWEVEGGMWLEADCNIPSGESLVRQLIKGKQFFKDEFNVDSKILWLPDVFGYSAALPQILKKIGIEYFMTTKISWNEYNKMPYDTFLWEGIDGTDILTYFVTTNDYSKVINNEHRTIYEGNINPSQVKGTYQRYQQKRLNKDVMMVFGHGDGGGGPTYQMLEHSKRIKKGIPGCPTVKHTSALEYFTTLESKIKDSKLLPKWVGELYLEYHRGTYTTSAKSKKYNRVSETLIHDVEFLMQINHLLFGQTVDKEFLAEIWQIILLNQFHDIIPGTSIQQVYTESYAQYESIIFKMNEKILGFIENMKERINSPKPAIIVLNTTSFTRSDLIEFSSDTNYSHLSLENKIFPLQKTSKGTYISYVSELLPLGYTTFYPVNKKEKEGSYNQSSDRLENNYLVLGFDSKGLIISIFDKVAKRDLVDIKKPINQLIAYEDIPHNWDAWDINEYYVEKSYPINELISTEIIESGTVRTILRQVRKYQSSTITQDITIYNNSRRIDFITTIDWSETHTLLRVVHPFKIHALHSTFDIQYGNVNRKTHNNTSWDNAMFEVPGQKWVNICEDNYGVSMLTDSKYGYSAKGSTIGLSLLKSAMWPCEDIDKGRNQFTYSILPQPNRLFESDTIKEGYFLNYPLYVFENGGKEGDVKQALSTFKTNKENIIIEVIKSSEIGNDTILRLYETCNRFTQVTISSIFSILEVNEVTLDEHLIKSVDVDSNSYTVDFSPYEIKTFQIVVKK